MDSFGEEPNHQQHQELVVDNEGQQAPSTGVSFHPIDDPSLLNNDDDVHHHLDDDGDDESIEPVALEDTDIHDSSPAVETTTETTTTDKVTTLRPRTQGTAPSTYAETEEKEEEEEADSEPIKFGRGRPRKDATTTTANKRGRKDDDKSSTINKKRKSSSAATSSKNKKLQKNSTPPAKKKKAPSKSDSTDNKGDSAGTGEDGRKQNKGAPKRESYTCAFKAKMITDFEAWEEARRLEGTKKPLVQDFIAQRNLPPKYEKFLSPKCGWRVPKVRDRIFRDAAHTEYKDLARMPDRTKPSSKYADMEEALLKRIEDCQQQNITLSTADIRRFAKEEVRKLAATEQEAAEFKASNGWIHNFLKRQRKRAEEQKAKEKQQRKQQQENKRKSQTTTTTKASSSKNNDKNPEPQEPSNQHQEEEEQDVNNNIHVALEAV